MGRLGYTLRRIAEMDYSAFLKTVQGCHAKSGKNRVWLFADLVKCGFKFGAGYRDYDLLEFYNMNDAQRSTFVTRGVNNQIVRTLNDPAYYHIFDNKDEFYALFAEYLHRDWFNLSTGSKEGFLEFMNGGGAIRDAVIAKPSDASCGQGIEKLMRADFDSLDALYAYLISRDVDLIEEVVVQHPDMARLNSSSVNTIRVYTVLVDGEAHVVYACVRMGNSDRPVDNINAGGMYAALDLSCGEIAGPACDKSYHVYERHPRSGTVLPGYRIPFWDTVLSLCREAAMKVPQMGYLGWDVAITEQGPLLIEANNMPGHDAFPQMPSQAPDHVGFKPAFQKYLKDL